MIEYHFVLECNSINNGGSTDYYKFKENWGECADIIEDREMNYNQGMEQRIATFTFFI